MDRTIFIALDFGVQESKPPNLHACAVQRLRSVRPRGLSRQMIRPTGGREGGRGQLTRPLNLMSRLGVQEVQFNLGEFCPAPCFIELSCQVHALPLPTYCTCSTYAYHRIGKYEIQQLGSFLFKKKSLQRVAQPVRATRGQMCVISTKACTYLVCRQRLDRVVVHTCMYVCLRRCGRGGQGQSVSQSVSSSILVPDYVCGWAHLLPSLYIFRERCMLIRHTSVSEEGVKITPQ